MLKRCYDYLVNQPGTKTSKSYRINGYNGVLFIKKDKDTVYMYTNSYGNISALPLLVLKKDYYFIHGKVTKRIWSFQYICRKNILENVNFRWERNGYILTFVDGREMVLYDNLKIDYSGKAYGKHPQKYVDIYNNLKTMNRLQANAQSRSRYHNNKAMERMRASYVEGEGPDISKIPMDDVFKLWNVSHRRLIIDYYGMDSIIASLDSKVIDTDTINNNYYELISVNIPDNAEASGYRKATYLRMINPSTDEIHFEGVPNYEKPVPIEGNSVISQRDTLMNNTVNAALAWRNNDNGIYHAPVKLT